VAAAREQLRRAFQEVGVPANWQEWDRGNPSSPDYARRYGSPTILVEGRDVASPHFSLRIRTGGLLAA
jgi:mercuric ion transport protein